MNLLYSKNTESRRLLCWDWNQAPFLPLVWGGGGVGVSREPTLRTARPLELKQQEGTRWHSSTHACIRPSICPPPHSSFCAFVQLFSDSLPFPSGLPPVSISWGLLDSGLLDSLLLPHSFSLSQFQTFPCPSPTALSSLRVSCPAADVVCGLLLHDSPGAPPVEGVSWIPLLSSDSSFLTSHRKVPQAGI